MKLGPYLANPYYSTNLESLEQKDNERNTLYIKCVNDNKELVN